MGGHYKRSLAAAIQIGIGNCGGIVASFIYVTNQAPEYHTGFGTGLGLIGLCGITACIMYFGLKHENRKRDRGERDYRYQEDPSELENMGDDHPEFRFAT